MIKVFRLLVPGLLMLLASASGWSAERAASVVFASGATAIVAADGARRTALRGAVVYAGEAVDTGADGRAQLRFEDGASMSLQPGTRFQVDDYRFSGGTAAGAEDRSFFSLVKGGFRTISGLIGKGRREQYRVSTTVATIGIRGTEYTAQFDGQALAVATMAGAVEVCNQAGCVLVNAGERTVVTAPDRLPEVQATPLPDGAALLPETPNTPAAAPSFESTPAAGQSPTSSATRSASPTTYNANGVR